ncbi:MAG: hypothetical protein ABJH04_09480 [Cyclobacteriaceae bacterium]
MVATAVSTQDQITNLLTEELSGLCNTCAHKYGCAYRIRSSKLMLQCELFELEKENHINRIGWGYEELKVNSRKGLCSNCLNEPHCQLPNAIGGVWHCEEYV